MNSWNGSMEWILPFCPVSNSNICYRLYIYPHKWNHIHKCLWSYLSVLVDQMSRLFFYEICHLKAHQTFSLPHIYWTKWMSFLCFLVSQDWVDFFLPQWFIAPFLSFLPFPNASSALFHTNGMILLSLHA